MATDRVPHDLLIVGVDQDNHPVLAGREARLQRLLGERAHRGGDEKSERKRSPQQDARYEFDTGGCQVSRLEDPHRGLAFLPRVRSRAPCIDRSHRFVCALRLRKNAQTGNPRSCVILGYPEVLAGKSASTGCQEEGNAAGYVRRDSGAQRFIAPLHEAIRSFSGDDDPAELETARRILSGHSR